MMEDKELRGCKHLEFMVSNFPFSSSEIKGNHPKIEEACDNASFFVPKKEGIIKFFGELHNNIYMKRSKISQAGRWRLGLFMRLAFEEDYLLRTLGR